MSRGDVPDNELSPRDSDTAVRLGPRVDRARYSADSVLGPNRHNSSSQPQSLQQFSAYNHHFHVYHSPPQPLAYPPASDPATLYSSPPVPELREPPAPAPPRLQPTPAYVPSTTPSSLSRNTLLWGNFEPWMDEEYAKQVCGLMGWDPVSIKVPQPAPNPATGQQANNPGYCFLTFPSPVHAANVLAQIHNSGRGSPLTMPNSSKPFVLNWAPAVPSSMSSNLSTPSPTYSGTHPQYQREYSIFVGDLAPETSNSDLVAVFRDPVLGLRNDREPKIIEPFRSCTSAKIMLDPVTGVSRGYGFVRFASEADQRRALIEMHGLYCLSRPMRISPATAKFKPPSSLRTGFGQGPVDNQAVTVAFPLPNGPQAKSVSTPIAATNSNSSLGSNSVQGSSSNNSMGGSSSGGSLSSSAPSTLPQGFSNSDPNNVRVPSLLSENQLRQVLGQTPDGYFFSEESWKHHAQARAILGNLIGPNGEQLTSTDPYNTTVFVGGLSPLISEETLRTFFAPFGDIHYVKVPVGKNCGFVQFVRKADAERAIEKMQGFPIGGSRIRLSWGRSQYKAAQAAAQAAHAAALQAARYTAPAIPNGNGMTPEQAYQLLCELTQQGYISPGAGGPPTNENPNVNGDAFSTAHLPSGLEPDGNKIRSGGPDTPHQNLDAFSSNGTGYLPRPDIQRTLSNFSPFSPNPNSSTPGDDSTTKLSRGERDASSSAVAAAAFGPRSEALPHPSKAYAPGFYPHQLQTQDLNPALMNGGPPPTTIHTSTSTAVAGKLSPSARSPSVSRYGTYLDMQSDSRTIVRPDSASRHSSGLHSNPSMSLRRDRERLEADHSYGDMMEDLNRTVASLDLDHSWQSPEVNNHHGGSGYYQQQHQHAFVGSSNSNANSNKPTSPK